MHVMQNCTQCGSDSRCRRRDFSEQAWAVLLSWKEVEKKAVDAPICDECYDDLRDILIDRADEMAVAVARPGRGASTKKTATSAKKKTAKKKTAASRSRGKSKRAPKVA